MTGRPTAWPKLESMNLASLWKLPVLFACENNLYAMGTAYNLSEAVTNLMKKAEGYGVQAAAVGGMEVLAVEAATKKAVEHVRAGKGPYLLELRTYRFRAHSMFDPELYREKSEVEEWKARDPIWTFVGHLKELNLIDQERLNELERDVLLEVDEAVRFAEAGTGEPLSDLERFVYSEKA